MKWESLNKNWFFRRGLVRYFPGTGEENYGKKVDLPHDYMIESDVRKDAPAADAMGYYTEGPATYTKKIYVPEEWKGQQILLYFDGVMMNASVYVNGDFIQTHSYGYTPFAVNITDHLYYGEENRISVLVNPSMQPNSRWYTGAGIYRNVKIAHGNPIHIVPDGIFAWTKRIISASENTGSLTDGGQKEELHADEAQIMIEVTVKNSLPRDHQVRVSAILSADFQRTDIRRETTVLVKAGSTAVARIPMTVNKPFLWDAEHTCLYKIKTILEDMGTFGLCLDSSAAFSGIMDEAVTTFGIRTVSADPVRGLQVNGKTVKLKGGCIHHDHGVLGAVSLYDSEYRRLKLLKESGFNAVRLAHNPPSSVLLDACDQIGLYVIDEAFDAWLYAKQPGDYSRFFADHWKEDMEAFITRDRNHPSILLWSTGNEVEERGGMGNGYTLAAELAEFVRSLDSTRLVTNGLCSMWSGLDDRTADSQFQSMPQTSGEAVQNFDPNKHDTFWEERTEAFAGCLDVVGYNYLDGHYEYDGERYPERLILGTESYPNQMDKVWALTEKLPYVIGDCTWTAFDYIGEAGIGKSAFFEEGDPELEKGIFAVGPNTSPYPWRLANDADYTINGEILPQGIYRRIMWGSSETGLFTQHPEYFDQIEVVSLWGWNRVERNWNFAGYEGRQVRIFTYSAADEVKLFLNGKVVGTAPAGKANRFTACFEIPYSSGTLTAVSYMNGKEISRSELCTTGAPDHIVLRPECTELTADGSSLSYIHVEICDSDENIVPNAQIRLEAVLEHKECAALAGFGSSNPITEDNYSSGRCTSFRGKATAVIRSGYETGAVLFKVSADTLGTAECTIQIK